jgi:hypothetical protein
MAWVSEVRRFVTADTPTLDAQIAQAPVNSLTSKRSALRRITDERLMPMTPPVQPALGSKVRLWRKAEI